MYIYISIIENKCVISRFCDYQVFLLHALRAAFPIDVFKNNYYTPQINFDAPNLFKFPRNKQ